MKKITLLFVIFYSLTLHAQWKQTATGLDRIRDISVVNNDVIWAKDWNYKLISYTINGGASWITKSLPAGFEANAVGGLCAVSATTAYFTLGTGGGKGIYKTSDGATSWTRQGTAFNDTLSFPDFVYFWNENEGVAVGDAVVANKFEIYTTTDGGAKWNLVSGGSIPSISGAYTGNSNGNYRVHGNTIYFMASAGDILKSTDKGLTWSKITGIPDTGTKSFDFKDDNNGVYSLTNGATINCYTTIDGGANWLLSPNQSNIGSVFYSPLHNAYFARNYSGACGLSYSNDNGQTWTNHPSFLYVNASDVFGYSPTGRVFIGGTGSLFYSDNYKGENIAVKSSKLINANSIDVSYSLIPDLVTAKDTSNYSVYDIYNRVKKKLKIKSITQDVTDKTLLHLMMNDNLPSDTIAIVIRGIYDATGIAGGNAMIYNQPGYINEFYNFNTEKTVTLTTAGTLLTQFSAAEKRTLKKLTLSGIIDARDFRIMRDSLPLLSQLDLSGTKIAEYTGSEGTTTDTYYYADEIPMQAFNSDVTGGKKSLLSVVLPNTLLSVSDYSFMECTGLSSITIPSSVFYVGSYAFSYCSALKTIVLPDSLETLYNYSFFNSGLTTINIPKRVKTIQPLTFAANFDLASITVDKDNGRFSTLDGILFNKSQDSLLISPSAKSGTYSIPNSVKLVGSYAFYYNMYLSEVFIPNSVEVLSLKAFKYCSGLQTVSIGSSVKSIGIQCFYSCRGLKTIAAFSPIPVDLGDSTNVFYSVNKTNCELRIPKGSLTAYKAAKQWKDFINMIEFNPNDLKTIQSDKVSIYPNPVINDFQIKGIEGKANLNVFGIDGQQLLTRQITDNETISVGTLSKGIYMVKISSKEGVIEKKLVKN